MEWNFHYIDPDFNEKSPFLIISLKWWTRSWRDLDRDLRSYFWQVWWSDLDLDHIFRSDLDLDLDHIFRDLWMLWMISRGHVNFHSVNFFVKSEPSKQREVSASLVFHASKWLTTSATMYTRKYLTNIIIYQVKKCRITILISLSALQRICLTFEFSGVFAQKWGTFSYRNSNPRN